jgi:tripartite ATP-independent transporter DctM subunit
MITTTLFAILLILMLLRVPVSMAFGLALVSSMMLGGYDLRSVPQIMVQSAKSFELMAVPFFILAALLMNAFGMTQRIFDFSNSLVGFMRGGLAQVNVLGSMIFAGMSGAAVADAAGLGSIEIKAMRAAGYPLGFSAAVTVSSSTLGAIIPPSIVMIIYAVNANVSIARMFVAGIVPGVCIGLVLMAMIWVLVRFNFEKCPPPEPFSPRRVLATARDGILSLIAPAIIIWGMVGGVVTPTEAGVLAVGYSLVVGALYRAYNLSSIVAVLRDTVETTALIMYLAAVSSVLAWIIVNEGVAHDLTDWVSGITEDPIVFLIAVNLFLLIVGTVLETLPALLITVPVLLPAAIALGVDPVHFGVVVIFNLLIGMITPPVGIGLYIMMAISGVRYGELVRACVPFLLALLIALAILTFFPSLTLFLPDLLDV